MKKIIYGGNKEVMKKVLMISTGGTIAMSSGESGQGVIIKSSGVDLVKNLNKFNYSFDLEILDFASIPSSHMSLELLQRLSELINIKIKSNDIDAIVVTHGTDSIEETAYFLELTTNSEKPIVLVGSLKNSSDLGYEGSSNLKDAFNVAIDEKSKDKGVLVVMNGQIHSAYYVEKTHTTAIEGFSSLEFGPLGAVRNDKVVYHRNIVERQYYELLDIEKKVGIVKCAVGVSSDIIKFYLNNNYRGIVIEAFGAGNVSREMSIAIKEAIKKGVPVIVTSRCINGSIEAIYGYEGGGVRLKEIGIISGNCLSSQKARIKLSILLGSSYDLDSIREKFENYIS